MRHVALLAWLSVALVPGCTRASRFPALPTAKKAEAAEGKPAKPPAHYSWLMPEPRQDVPILFVPSSSKEWSALPETWNQYPAPAAGVRTIHLGLPPLHALAALGLAQQFEQVKIKVPLGLPDPTPHIPAVNPPTLGKWRLGRKLFYDKLLTSSGGASMSCASCHVRERGFSEARGATLNGERNTLSLLNVVYNKRQFWDGRVAALEETIVRALADETPGRALSGRDKPEITHRWGGMVRKIASEPEYVRGFEAAFGIRQPTQDAIAKSLATYLRTLLAGDSIFDRADQERAEAGVKELEAAHFVKALDEKKLFRLGFEKTAAAKVAERLMKGYEVFSGKGRCATCHGGPLFTNQQFYNTGLAEAPNYLLIPKEAGRFGSLPVGLKDASLIGAFRTASLRNLPRTAPYFHDGSAADLERVIEYYKSGVFVTSYLAKELLEGRDQKNLLSLTPQEEEALVLFLRSLDGDAVVFGPAEVAAVPQEKVPPEKK